jgi:dTDP-4-amino-4,6-dideoxygalactose transaminase
MAGARVLAPAYVCGSEIDPLLKAGLVVDHYRIRPDLTPDFDHLTELCARPAQALYVIHYFGFPQPIEALLAFARMHQLLLLEDNAHGLYSALSDERPLGTFGDAAFFSLRKTLPVPDGGALVLRDRAAPQPTVRPSPFAVAGKVRFLAEQASAQRFPRGTPRVKRALMDPMVALVKAWRRDSGGTQVREGPDEVLWLVPDRVEWRMSAVSRHLLLRTAHEAVRRRRQLNYAALAAAFPERCDVVPLLPGLPRGTCPLFFPVRCGARTEALQRHLAKHAIGSKRFWSWMHPDVPIDRFPFEAALKREVLVLPVHQSLDEEDMGRLADTIATWPG